MSSITTTCPVAASTATNRSKLSAIWNSQEWKDFVKHHTTRIGKCEQCGKREGDIAINSKGEEYTIHLTVDHPFRWAYKSPKLYLDFKTAMCRVVCRSCNSLFEKGLDICPECLENYKQMREPVCRDCLFKKYPKAKEEYERGQQDQKDRQNARNRKKRALKFPCALRSGNQRCKRSSYACTMSAKTAHGCKFFKERVKE